MFILGDMKPDFSQPFDLRAQLRFVRRAGHGRDQVANLGLHKVSHQIAEDLLARLEDLHPDQRGRFVRIADLASHPSLSWELVARELGGKPDTNASEDTVLRVTDEQLAQLQNTPPLQESSDKTGDKNANPQGNPLGKSDLVISHLSLHLQNDLPRILAFVRSLLAPGGLFLASVAGPETLSHLRNLFLQAETRLYGGAGAHIASFPDPLDLGRLLQATGFTLPVLERDILHHKWDSAHDLMHELRAFGVSNSLTVRRRTVSPRKLFDALEQLWQESDKHETFEAIYLTAWAPAEDQQQPMRPGTAEQSLTQSLEAEGQETSTQDLKKTS